MLRQETFDRRLKLLLQDVITNLLTNAKRAASGDVQDDLVPLKLPLLVKRHRLSLDYRGQGMYPALHNTINGAGILQDTDKKDCYLPSSTAVANFGINIKNKNPYAKVRDLAKYLNNSVFNKMVSPYTKVDVEQEDEMPAMDPTEPHITEEVVYTSNPAQKQTTDPLNKVLTINRYEKIALKNLLKRVLIKKDNEIVFDPQSAEFEALITFFEKL
jgi:hypothetical protein